MSMDEFDVQVAWPGAQPSPSGRGGASAAQEPKSKQPVAAAAEGEDELTLLSPFILMQMYTWLRRRRLPQTRFQSHP